MLIIYDWPLECETNIAQKWLSVGRKILMRITLRKLFFSSLYSPLLLLRFFLLSLVQNLQVRLSQPF